MTATNKEKVMDQNREPSQPSALSQRRFSLRAKITIGNLALTFAIILVMGIFIFFRILNPESSRRLDRPPKTSASEFVTRY